MLHEPGQQAHLFILLFDETMTEEVGEGERAQRADSIDEERVGAVERVDVAAVRQGRPTPGLHRAADFEREGVEPALPLGRFDAALDRHPPQRTVGADVVEAVIVDADVRQVRRHARQRALAAELEELPFTGGVELQERTRRTEILRSTPSTRARCSAR